MSKSPTFVSGISPFEVSFESYKFKFKRKRNYPIHIVFRISLQILCANLKNFEHESCLLYETLQLLFWAKINLSYGLHFVFSDRFSIF